MALKHLQATGMVELSQPLVTDGTPERAAVLAIPETAVILPHIEAAHRSILATEASGPDEKQFVALSAEQATLDARHDDLRRGAYSMLTACGFLARQPQQAEGFRKLRDRLFPGGLSMTQLAYVDQAGAGQVLEAKLDDATRETLSQVRHPGGDLLADTLEIVQLSRRLGDLEREKGAGTDPTVSRAGRSMAARNAWIRAINSLLASIELAGSTDPVIARLRDRIVLAADKAGRAATTSPATAAGPAPTTTPAEPAPVPAPAEPEPV